MTGWAIVLAVVGAGCYALGARWHNRAVQNTHTDPCSATLEDGHRRSGRARILPLLRHRGWLGGLGMLGAGTVLHVTALSLAPLTVVQPVGVLALPLAALLDAHARQARLPRRATAAVVACTIGVVGFVARAATITTQQLGTRTELTQIVTLLVAVAVGLAILSAASRTASRRMAIGPPRKGVVALRPVRSLGQITAAAPRRRRGPGARRDDGRPASSHWARRPPTSSLVRTNGQGTMIRAALADAGVPASRRLSTVPNLSARPPTPRNHASTWSSPRSGRSPGSCDR